MDGLSTQGEPGFSMDALDEMFEGLRWFKFICLNIYMYLCCVMTVQCSELSEGAGGDCSFIRAAIYGKWWRKRIVHIFFYVKEIV